MYNITEKAMVKLWFFFIICVRMDRDGEKI